jgi:sulfur carrier protein ThiS
VTIELWLGLNEELRGDFESLSKIRSRKEEDVKEGTTIRQLLDYLASCNFTFAQKVFDPEAKCLHPHLIINYNDRVINPYEVYDKILENGDKITILTMYAGG